MVSLIIAYNSYYKMPFFMASVHNELYENFNYPDNYNSKDAIKTNIEFSLNSTNTRIITIWPNKSVSFDVSSYDQDNFISDEYWSKNDQIVDRYANNNGFMKD